MASPETVLTPQTERTTRPADPTPYRLPVESNGDEYRYRVDDAGHAYIARCKTAASEVRIPAQLGGCPVAGLDEGSFSQLGSVERVMCPHCLRHIGDRAFEGCMRLHQIALNDGLETIGQKAFFLCRALSELNLPHSVRELGVNVTGAKESCWRAPETDVRLAPQSPFLFFSAENVLYERSEDGLVLVDATMLDQTHFTCDARTVRIGPQAFARNLHVQSVTLTSGVRRIGQEAFRGCNNLRRIDLPNTLESIEDAAFSCTALEELTIPANCTHASNHALTTGPVLEGLPVAAHGSHLRRIQVAEGNPVLSMRGGLLCRKRADGLFQAVLCPSEIDLADLDERVADVADTAFAGTTRIGTLRIDARTTYQAQPGLVPHGKCDRLVIANADGAGTDLEVRLPNESAFKRLMQEGFSMGVIDSIAIAHAYDSCVAQLKPSVTKAELTVERLARPFLLTRNARDDFQTFVTGALKSICIHFGREAYLEGFDQLVDAEVITSENISALAGMLAEADDALASSYVLALNRTRFGEACWDYDL